jgi:hypothetical protein
MSDSTYRIKYKKADFEVEIQGDKKWVEDKFKELTSLKPQEEGQKDKSLSSLSNMTTSLVEFYDSKGAPKGNPEITLVFAYWLLKHDNINNFTAKDIDECYNQTKVCKPRNINDVLDSNIQKRLFGEGREKKDGKKTWEIIRSGIEAVEQMNKT